MYTPYNPASPYSNLLMGQQPKKEEVVKVSGRPGAEAYQLDANSSALLLDTTAAIVWLVQTDGAGYKTLTPYDISPHVEIKPEDQFKSLEERISKLEERLNAKSYSGTNYRESKQHNDAGNRGNDKG